MAVKVHNIKDFWKWWSVRLGLMSASLAAAATAYGAVAAISPGLVSGLPEWFGVVITGGSMITAAAGVWARGIAQEGLEE